MLLSLPPSAKVSASSEKWQAEGSSCQAENAYIFTNKAWCSKTDNSEFGILLLNFPYLLLYDALYMCQIKRVQYCFVLFANSTGLLMHNLTY